MLFDRQNLIMFVLVRAAALLDYFKVTCQCRIRKEIENERERNSLCPGLGLVYVENRPESRSNSPKSERS